MIVVVVVVVVVVGGGGGGGVGGVGGDVVDAVGLGFIVVAVGVAVVFVLPAWR